MLYDMLIAFYLWALLRFEFGNFLRIRKFESLNYSNFELKSNFLRLIARARTSHVRKCTYAQVLVQPMYVRALRPYPYILRTRFMLYVGTHDGAMVLYVTTYPKGMLYV